jgi:hypothetical protein
VTLLCRAPIMGGRVGKVGEDPVAAGVEHSQAIRAFGIAVRCRQRPRL